MSSPERLTEKPPKRLKPIDFSKVGGLSNHIRILRDIIIVPLLHNNVYAHFNIKTPRGVLFYGPPGTGKTLVAGALATELNREGFGKVTFFQRKGADVLDKWVGESEKKLRALFEIATKSRPSVIFFDELDGLAPIRSSKNDHVHCSIVTTLLSLMDGLDSMPGVIIIGATNRIESLDPALRRPGRFDRELYFPLPSTNARKEILQVHTQSWRCKPALSFLDHLAEITSGFCGSDLQALCAEALLCSLKRLHPSIQKTHPGSRIKIEADTVTLEECDFLTARRNMVPSTQRLGNKMRKLSPIIQPLLQRQLAMILNRLETLWPHFAIQFHKYLVGSERYIGRMVLVGSNSQGLNNHLLPAILQNFEHLPAHFVDVSVLDNRLTLANFCQNIPSILVIPHVDELYSFIDINEQLYITSTLEDLHAELPILIIVTCEEQLPVMLQNFFYNNTSLIIPVESALDDEVGAFFSPLFFGDVNSLVAVLLKSRQCERKSSCDGRMCRKSRLVKQSLPKILKSKPGNILKPRSIGTLRNSLKIISDSSKQRLAPLTESRDVESLCTLCGTAQKKKQLSLILTELLQKSLRHLVTKKSSTCCRRSAEFANNFGESTDADKQKIYSLFRRTVLKTARDMPLSHLEVLYDTISACLSIYRDNFEGLVKNLESALSDIELAKEECV